MITFFLWKRGGVTGDNCGAALYGGVYSSRMGSCFLWLSHRELVLSTRRAVGV